MAVILDPWQTIVNVNWSGGDEDYKILIIEADWSAVRCKATPVNWDGTLDPALLVWNDPGVAVRALSNPYAQLRIVSPEFALRPEVIPTQWVCNDGNGSQAPHYPDGPYGGPLPPSTAGGMLEVGGDWGNGDALSHKNGGPWVDFPYGNAAFEKLHFKVDLRQFEAEQKRLAELENPDNYAPMEIGFEFRAAPNFSVWFALTPDGETVLPPTGYSGEVMGSITLNLVEYTCNKDTKIDRDFHLFVVENAVSSRIVSTHTAPVTRAAGFNCYPSCIYPDRYAVGDFGELLASPTYTLPVPAPDEEE